MAQRAELRMQLLAEIGALTDADGLALWAHKRLSAKNRLTAEDARTVEEACLSLLQVTFSHTPQDLDQPPSPLTPFHRQHERSPTPVEEKALYQIPEAVTPVRGYPNQHLFDSTWRTKEVRHAYPASG